MENNEVKLYDEAPAETVGHEAEDFGDYEESAEEIYELVTVNDAEEHKSNPIATIVGATLVGTAAVYVYKHRDEIKQKIQETRKRKAEKKKAKAEAKIEELDTWFYDNPVIVENDQ